MVTTVAKKPEVVGKLPPARPDDANVTSVKATRRLARMITQLGALLGVNQQDVLERYAKLIEEDLLRELAKRQAEIREGRTGTA